MCVYCCPTLSLSLPLCLCFYVYVSVALSLCIYLCFNRCPANVFAKGWPLCRLFVFHWAGGCFIFGDLCIFSIVSVYVTASVCLHLYAQAWGSFVKMNAEGELYSNRCKYKRVCDETNIVAGEKEMFYKKVTKSRLQGGLPDWLLACVLAWWLAVLPACRQLAIESQQYFPCRSGGCYRGTFCQSKANLLE